MKKLLLIAIIATSISISFAQKYMGTTTYLSTEGVEGNDIQVDQSGYTTLSGIFYDTTYLNPNDPQDFIINNSFYEKMFIAHYDPSGNLVFSLASNDSLSFSSEKPFVIDGSGNVYITGTVTGPYDFDFGVDTAFVYGNTKTFLAKYNAGGDFQWVRVLSENPFVASLDMDANGYFYLTGSFNGTIDFDASISNTTLTAANSSGIYLVKYDDQGIVHWAHGFTGLDGNYAGSVHVDYLNNVWLTGTIGVNGTTTIDFDLDQNQTANLTAYNGKFIAKYGSDGSYQTAKMFSTSSDTYMNGITTDQNGNLLLSGKFGQQHNFDLDGGSTSLTGSFGVGSAFIAKYNADIEIQWVHAILGNVIFGSSGTDVAIDQDNGVSFVGFYQGEVDVDPGIGEFLLPEVAEQEMFIVQYGENGDFLWAGSLAGDGYDVIKTCYIQDTTLYLSGYFSGTCDFDADTIDQDEHSSPSQYITGTFISKYSTSIPPSADTTGGGDTTVIDTNTSISTIEHMNSISIYPNPATEVLSVIKDISVKSTSVISIYDAQGKLMYQDTWAINEVKKEVNISSFAAGNYHLKVQNNGSVKNMLFIKK